MKKRIALSVVTALAGGLLVAAPASAAGTQVFSVSTTAGDNTISTVSPTSRPGVFGSYTAKFKAGVTNDTSAASAVFRIALSAKPAGSAATAVLANNSTGTDNGFDTTAVTGGGTSALTYTTSTGAAVTAAAGSLQADVTFTPDLVGTYTFVVWYDANSNTAIDAGEAYVTKTVTIATDAPAISIAAVNATGSTTTGANKGALVKVSLTNGAAATNLAGTEALSVSITGATGTAQAQKVGSSSAVTTLTRADFGSTGSLFLNVTDTAADSIALTIAGAVGSAVSGVSATQALSFVAPTTVGTKLASVAVSNTTGVAVATNDNFVDAAKSTTVSYLITGAATASATAFGPNEKIEVTIADTTDGLLTGKASAGYTKVVTLGSTGTATFSITANLVGAEFATAPIVGTPQTIGTVNFEESTDVQKSLKAAVAGPSKFTVAPALVRAVAGAGISGTFTVLDQFGIGVAYTPVSAALSSSSRNYGAVAPIYGVTNGSGMGSFTYVDAPLAANAALTSDSWTLSATNSGARVGTSDGAAAAYADGAFAATIVSALGVAAVTLAYPGDTDTIAGTTTTDISAAKAGATGSKATVVATVTDANGSLLAGVPVAFTVSGLVGAEVTTTTSTVYTASDGTATAYVASYAAGTATVTATAAGKSASGSLYFKQATATEARTISAAVSGNLVTASVKDRYGNAVAGVTVNATRTGAGYFGAGASSAQGVTDKNGVVEFVVIPGATATVVTVAFTSSDYGQSADAAGKVGASAVTAAAAGTASTDQVGLGAALAPAGVNSATATVAAAAAAVADPAIAAAKVAADAATAAANAAAAAAAKAGTDAVAAAATAKAAADAAAAAAAKAGTDAVAAAAAAGVKAEAATAAAKAASDAVAAVSTAVAGLQTTVASLVASMTAQIKVINASMLKIAKKLGVKI